ncbi:MAG: hypothetical protein ABEH43_04915, partial [Flavobacteriales bacterium]
MEATTQKKKPDIKESFLSLLDEHYPKKSSKCINELRNEGFNSLKDIEVPHSKVERWKYTRVNKILKKNYTPSINEVEPNIDISPYSIKDQDCDQVVLINGCFSEKLSKINKREGVSILPILEASEEFPELFERH